MVDLESDVSYFQVTSWSGFLMEGVCTRLQIDFFRLISFGSPTFNSLTLRFVALENLNLSTSNLSTA